LSQTVAGLEPRSKYQEPAATRCQPIDPFEAYNAITGVTKMLRKDAESLNQDLEPLDRVLSAAKHLPASTTLPRKPKRPSHRDAVCCTCSRALLADIVAKVPNCSTSIFLM
jgi:hypothetical protein